MDLLSKALVLAGACNLRPAGRTRPTSCFVNKVSLAHGLAHRFVYGRPHVHALTVEPRSCSGDPLAPEPMCLPRDLPCLRPATGHAVCLPPPPEASSTLAVTCPTSPQGGSRV